MKRGKTTVVDSDNEGVEMNTTPRQRSKTSKLKKGATMGGMGNKGDHLSQDFKSFDLLWFDLSTKVRALVHELCQPIVDKTADHKELLMTLVK